MNLFRAFLDFLADDRKSMRLDAVSERMRDEFGDLRYKTIADGKRDMRDDMRRLHGDFRKAMNKASENGKESRAE